jgi:inactivated superfamily I helicase/RecB family exonuclease
MTVPPPGPAPVVEGAAPRLFHVPPGADFAAELAAGLRARLAGRPPETMARVDIVVSTRRGRRALEAAFEGDAPAAFLPRIRPLALIGADPAEAPDLPPSVCPARRLLTLSRLVEAYLSGAEGRAPGAAAPALAASLARLLDEFDREGADLDALDAAAPPEHARHWDRSLAFLRILREAWPAIRAETEGGAVEPEARRRLAVEAQAAAWAAAPPDRPVIAAGSTGSVGTTARLLDAVARLPQGAVVLPGFDPDLAADIWDDIGPEHPWRGFRRLADRLGLGARDIPPWRPEAGAVRRERRRLIAEALRPAPATDGWMAARASLAAEAEAATEGLTLVEAPDPRREAAAVALAMRGAVEDGARAALVTPDRTLARRVAAALRRWGIEADDSGGRPLALTPPGVFLRLCAEAACGALQPAPLLGLLKHPLLAAGPGRAGWLAAVRRFELSTLRRTPGMSDLSAVRAALRAAAERAARDRTGGARAGTGRDAPDADGETAATAADGEATGNGAPAVRAREDRSRGDATPADRASADRAPGDRAQGDATPEDGPPADADAPGAALSGWAATVDAALARLAEAGRAGPTLADLAAAHIAAAEALSGPALWETEAGEAARAAADRFLAAAPAYGPCPPGAYPALFAAALAGAEVREPAFRPDPRAMIWGPLEARMQGADLLILGGLAEGAWPAPPEPDAWLGREMRERVGLPPLEIRLGLAAHDFLQAACAPRAILTRAKRSGEAPATPSRWLARLSTLLDGVAPEALAGMRARGRDLLDLAAALERADAEAAFAPRATRPRPAPPAAARPTEIWATEVQTLVRDPYALYARRVLGLRALDPVGRGLDARDRGVALHLALARFARATADWPADRDPADWAAALAEAGEAAWRDGGAPASLRRLWRARLARLAPAFLGEEIARRALGAPLVEIDGERRLSHPPLTLRARADRVDRRAGGAVAVYDYKSGAVPSPAQIAAFDKQLPLEAAIALGGAWDGPEGALTATAVEELAHVALGGRDAGLAAPLEGDPATLAAEAWAGLGRLAGAYADPRRGYLSRARPKRLRDEEPYDHLARYGEWEDGDDPGAAPAP